MGFILALKGKLFQGTDLWNWKLLLLTSVFGIWTKRLSFEFNWIMWVSTRCRCKMLFKPVGEGLWRALNRIISSCLECLCYKESQLTSPSKLEVLIFQPEKEIKWDHVSHGLIHRWILDQVFCSVEYWLIYCLYIDQHDLHGTDQVQNDEQCIAH